MKSSVGLREHTGRAPVLGMEPREAALRKSVWGWVLKNDRRFPGKREASTCVPSNSHLSAERPPPLPIWVKCSKYPSGRGSFKSHNELFAAMITSQRDIPGGGVSMYPRGKEARTGGQRQCWEKNDKGLVSPLRSLDINLRVCGSHWRVTLLDLRFRKTNWPPSGP